MITSGEIHYARVPRALWEDRLLKLKRAGFNSVTSYFFWNY
ncbi:MAG: beta-galactosidase, partial [Candidatus Marsarchaeota archaeon]